MKNYIIKTVAKTTLFLALLFLGGFLHYASVFCPVNMKFEVSIGLIISIGIYIGIFSYWSISIYSRIMQGHVRTYLMLIGVTIIFWIAVRSIKWYALSELIFEDRFFWYLYYIPMILLPLFFFFISLYVGENEDYKINKKVKLLFIPAIVLILLVLTNDFHKLAFDIDLNTHAYGLDYSHGIVYYIVVIFIFLIVMSSSVIIARKFIASMNIKKAIRLPALVIICTIIYCVSYVIKPTYGIGHYLDVTIFGSAMAVALLESFIRSGLIHSNIGHQECFLVSDIRAQILDDNGEVIYFSENALPLSKENFNIIKKMGATSFSNNTISNITKIRGGYVVWSNDVSQINSKISQLKLLRNKLHSEIDILSLENEQKSETARLEKLNDLHNIMLKEVLPFGKKIESKLQKNSDIDNDEMARLLFEISMTSTYIKRKVNLILTEQTEKCIAGDEMRRCFLESFQLLEFYGKTCVININSDYKFSLEKAMRTFDIYQNIIEYVHYNFDTIYITYNFSSDNIIFALQIATDVKIDSDDFADKKLQILNENDCYHISCVMQNNI